MMESQSEFGYTVKTVPHRVRGSEVPVQSSADTDEGFGEVIDQHPEEDAKCLRFTRLRIRGLYQNKLR